jgi:hypothetical protein
MSSKVVTAPEPVYIRLLDNETDGSGIFDAPPVTTATFYSGPTPVDFLRERMKEIVALNPWLESRFVKNKGQILLKHESCPTCTIFGVVTQDDLPASYSKDDNYWLAEYEVKKGGKCLNKDEPIFRVTVVECEPEKFVIVVSLAHAVGDGFTFYQLYGMLSMTTTPHALSVERNHEGQVQIAQVTSEVNKFFSSVGTIFNLIGRSISSKPCVIQSRIVKSTWIEEQKKTHNTNSQNAAAVDAATGAAVSGDGVTSSTPPPPPFISTNDILTTAFFNVTKSDVGFMAINFRNRYAGLTNNMAGNYEGLIGYQPSDYKDPYLIRQSISSAGDIVCMYGWMYGCMYVCMYVTLYV